MSGGADLMARGLAARALRGARVTIDSITPPLNGDGRVTSNRPLISGRAPALSRVSLLINGVVATTALATASGTWSAQPSARPNGTYTYRAEAAPSSNALTVTIDDPLQPLSDYQGRTALFDLNVASGVYWAGGTLHASSADLYAALGATVSGITASFGGVVDGSTYEYFPNPTFDALPMLANGSGYTASVASGELNVVVWSSTNGYVSWALAGYKGRAFRFSAEGRRGTATTNPPNFAHSLANALLGGSNTTNGPLTASTETFEVFGPAAVTGSSYWGLRGTNTGNGTFYSDNWSIREVMPLAGWGSYAEGDSGADALGWSCVFDGVLPVPPASGLKILTQADTGGGVHYIRLAMTATGDLVLSVCYNASVLSAATQTLLSGIAGGERVRIAFGIINGTNATDSGLVVSINGSPRQQYTAIALNVPGISHLRIGISHSGGSVFDGTINQVAFLKDRAPGDWCEFASRLDDGALALGGDSYVDGANGAALKTSLATATGLRCINIAAGGTSLANQVAAYQAKSYLAGLRFVHWDGSDNGFSSVTDDIANYQAMVDAQGGTGRFLFIAPVAVPNPAQASSAAPTAQSVRCTARTAAMIAAFGAAHVFNPLATLQALGDGGTDDNNDIAAGLVPRSQLYDATNGQVHLKPSAMTAVADAIHASGKIAAL